MSVKNLFNNRFSQKSKNSQGERTTEASRSEPSFFITQSIQASDVEELFIDTDVADIKLEASDESAICIFVFGSIQEENTKEPPLEGGLLQKKEYVDFRTEIEKGLLSIGAGFNENVIKGNMELVVSVPQMVFGGIGIENVTGDVEVCKGIKADGFDVNSETGNVSISLDSQKDTVVNAKTTTGNVHIMRNGLKLGQFTVTSTSIIKNPFRKVRAKKKAHILSGGVFTESGTITIE